MATARDISRESSTPPAQWVMWALGLITSVAMTLAGSAYAGQKETEHRITQLEADNAAHVRWAAEAKAANDARIRELEMAHAQANEEVRRLLGDVREDVAAIRGALRIPKN